MIRKVFYLIVIPVGMLIMSPPGNAAVSQKVSSFKDLKTVDIIIEDIDPGLGFTKNEIHAYVKTKLMKRLPALKIKKNSHDYIYVRIVALEVKKDHIAGDITIALKRRLILPDKETMITAGVRNYGNIFSVSKDRSFDYVKNILNNLLNTFVIEYRNSRDYYSGKRRGVSPDRQRRNNKGKTKENEIKVWGN